MNRQTMWKVASAGCALGSAMLARKALNKTWRITAGAEPPENPAASDVRWREALIWTAASAGVAGLARLVAKRGAAAGWTWFFDEDPPV